LFLIKDPPNNPVEVANIEPVAHGVPECNVLNNMEECPRYKKASRKKLESHQTKLSDFGTRRIDLRLRDEEVN
jgi:hypothetical protein